jgi:hypothetical protein
MLCAQKWSGWPAIWCETALTKLGVCVTQQVSESLAQIFPDVLREFWFSLSHKDLVLQYLYGLLD